MKKQLTLNEVRVFVKDAHEGQTDKAGNPYFEHLEAVEKILVELFPDAPEFARMAALGHDLIEDTEHTAQTLLDAGFPPEAVAIIILVSRDKSTGLTYMQWIKILSVSGNLWANRLKYSDNTHNKSPERIAKLPVEEQSIANRYERSMKILRKVI